MKNKKGQIGNLYNYVLVFVLVGLVLGVGLVVLDKFSQTASIGATAQGAINDTIDSITPIASDWLPIVVIVAVLGIILALVLGAFSSYRNRQ